MNDWRHYGDVVELVINPALETCGRPVRKLNGAPGLDHRHRSVDILQYSITVAHDDNTPSTFRGEGLLDQYGVKLQDSYCDFGHRHMIGAQLRSMK